MDFDELWAHEYYGIWKYFPKSKKFNQQMGGK